MANKTISVTRYRRNLSSIMRRYLSGDHTIYEVTVNNVIKFYSMPADMVSLSGIIKHE